MKLTTLAVLAALFVPSLASAQQMLTLKGAPTDGDGRVTVGDVFDNAGPLAPVVLGYRNGNAAILDAATVQSVVGANGGYWANPRGQRRIVVTAGADGTAGAASAPAAATQVIAQPQNPFTAQAAANGPAAGASAAPRFPVQALAAPPVSPARGAVVIHRMETVDVTWASASISLTMTGVAQKDAEVGDTLSIQNPASKKTIDAVVTGPGRAVAGPAADQYRATALQLSSR